MPITRRGFIGLCVGAVGTLSFGEAALQTGNGNQLLRPPIVKTEAEFISRCIRCYRCVSVCHTGAIVPAKIEDGLLELKTPKLNFHQGYCDFCNKCVEVCPTAALEPCDPFNPSSGRIGHAQLMPDRCLAFYSGCDKCVQECPYEAITVNEFGQPQINDKLCNGCGLCVFVCPALIYRSYTGSDERGIEVFRDNQSLKEGN